jgi:hypothetical protein
MPADQSKFTESSSKRLRVEGVEILLDNLSILSQCEPYASRYFLTKTFQVRSASNN